MAVVRASKDQFVWVITFERTRDASVPRTANVAPILTYRAANCAKRQLS